MQTKYIYYISHVEQNEIDSSLKLQNTFVELPFLLNSVESIKNLISILSEMSPNSQQVILNWEFLSEKEVEDEDKDES